MCETYSAVSLYPEIKDPPPHNLHDLFYHKESHLTKNLYAKVEDPTAKKFEFEASLYLNRWFWDQHRTFFAELTQASRIFILRDAKSNMRMKLSDESFENHKGVKNQHIEFLTKQQEEALYLLVVNPDYTVHQVEFRLPKKVQVSEVYVLFENRKILVQNGLFKDTLNPYVTHVYSTTPQLPASP